MHKHLIIAEVAPVLFIEVAGTILPFSDLKQRGYKTGTYCRH
jgi:hypothetical protein